MAVLSIKHFRSLCCVTCKPLHTTIRCLDESYYETLNLKPDCSTKEIRSAFIQLSKKYHPDANQTSENAHNHFIKINEAYSVLSRPDKRQEYDIILENDSILSRSGHVQSNTPGEKIWRDETIWHMRDKTQDGKYEHKPYYGIRGVRRISNTWIVIACFIFTAFGVGLQVCAIRSSFTMSRQVLDEKSKAMSKIHMAVRQQAENNGNERQIQLLRQKLQASPTE